MAFTLRSGVCPDRWRAMRTASARLEVATQSAFQEKFPYTMAVWGLLSGGSVMVRWAFAVASQIGRGGVSVAVTAAFANSSPGMLL